MEYKATCWKLSKLWLISISGSCTKYSCDGVPDVVGGIKRLSNYVMRNLFIVLVNEFGTSKGVDKIKQKKDKRKLYKECNKTIKF